MPLAFSPERIRYIRQRARNTHAALVPARDDYQRDRLYSLYREYVAHDADGKSLGRRKEAIRNSGEDGVAVQVCVTAVGVEPVALHDRDEARRPLTHSDARACGYKSVAALRDAWRARHPRTELVNLVWFVLGDQRDRDVYMNWTGAAGGDYTMNPRRAMDSDAPVLRPDEYRELGMAAKQRQTHERAVAALRLSELPASERMKRIEAVQRELGIKLPRMTQVIEDRLERVERRETAKRAA